jgi:hypothetical protein
MRSPGSRVMPAEMMVIRVGISKIRSLTGACWRCSPLNDQVPDLVDLVGSGDPRPGRAVGVEALADRPLLVVALAVPGGDVVDHGEAEDVVHGLAGGDPAAAPSDDDAELGLVVQLAGYRGVGFDVVVRAGHRSGRLGEHDRHAGFPVGVASGVVARAAELRDVLAVVHPDGEHVAAGTRQRSEPADSLRLDRGENLAVEPGGDRRPLLDDVEHPGSLSECGGGVADRRGPRVHDADPLGRVCVVVQGECAQAHEAVSHRFGVDPIHYQEG